MGFILKILRNIIHCKYKKDKTLPKSFRFPLEPNYLKKLYCLFLEYNKSLHNLHIYTYIYMINMLHTMDICTYDVYMKIYNNETVLQKKANTILYVCNKLLVKFHI